jgi:hypothetical protein
VAPDGAGLPGAIWQGRWGRGTTAEATAVRADEVAKPAAGDGAAAAYATLIADQLAEERAMKTSLEQRGISIIIGAGALTAPERPARFTAVAA